MVSPRFPAGPREPYTCTGVGEHDGIYPCQGRYAPGRYGLVCGAHDLEKVMRVYRAACITCKTKGQSTVVQSRSSSSIAGPGVPSTQRTWPQTKLRTSSAVASSSTRGTSPLIPIIHWLTRRVASVMVCSIAPHTHHPRRCLAMATDSSKTTDNNLR